MFLACSVCPFYSSRADIVPSRYVPPTWAAYPPEPEKLGELYELVRASKTMWRHYSHVLADHMLAFCLRLCIAAPNDQCSDEECTAIAAEGASC